MTEALRRARWLGADLALVFGYAEGADTLYRSVMSAEHDVAEAWVRTW